MCFGGGLSFCLNLVFRLIEVLMHCSTPFYTWDWSIHGFWHPQGFPGTNPLIIGQWLAQLSEAWKERTMGDKELQGKAMWMHVWEWTRNVNIFIC